MLTAFANAVFTRKGVVPGPRLPNVYRLSAATVGWTIPVARSIPQDANVKVVFKIVLGRMTFSLTGYVVRSAIIFLNLNTKCIASHLEKASGLLASEC